MNLVLLKNISLVGVHWGRYSCTYTFYRLNQALMLINDKKKLKTVMEPNHITTVWKDLLS
jgi:hypothetical protein